MNNAFGMAKRLGAGMERGRCSTCGTKMKFNEKTYTYDCPTCGKRLHWLAGTVDTPKRRELFVKAFTED